MKDNIIQYLFNVKQPIAETNTDPRQGLFGMSRDFRVTQTKKSLLPPPKLDLIYKAPTKLYPAVPDLDFVDLKKVYKKPKIQKQ